MDFLDMKADLEPKDYEWYRGVSGVWHHWFKIVMDGMALLHVQGTYDGGYWGNIVLGRDAHDDEIIFTTITKGTPHVPFKTPENCSIHLDSAWKEIITKEANRNKI